MADDKFTTMRVEKNFLTWLRERAVDNHRSPVQELNAIREVVYRFEFDKIKTDGTLTVSPDGKIHGDQVGDALRKLDAQVEKG